MYLKDDCIEVNKHNDYITNTGHVHFVVPQIKGANSRT